MELNKLHNLGNANKLTIINPSKSNAILISPKLNTQITKGNITIDNSSITISETAKDLGHLIDSKLNFQNIKIFESKLSRGVGMLYTLKAEPPREALCKIYFALFHFHLFYGLVAWGSSFPTYMSSLN